MRCVRARPSLATRWRRAHRGRSSEGYSCPYLFRWRSLREEWSCGAWWCSFPDKPPAHSENRWGRERDRSIPFSDQAIPLAAIVLSVALMPMRAITNISVMIFSATGRGLAIAAQLAIQSLATFLGTLVALFEFEMGVTSLSIGAFCGQFAALGVGLVALGRHHVWSSPSRNWLSRAASTSPTTAASGTVDGTRGFGENALLTSAIGLHAVGILGHARLYHGLLTALSNAVGHNLWAKSLEDARNLHSRFEITRSAWTPV